MTFLLLVVIIAACVVAYEILSIIREKQSKQRPLDFVPPEEGKASDQDDPYSPPEPSPVPPWHRPLKSLAERLAPFCGDVIDRLAKRKYAADPILTQEQSRSYGVITSAINQHGKLIEETILECLADREDLLVWQEPEYRFSHGDTNYHKAATVTGASLSQLPYGDGHEPHDVFAVDLMVYNRSTKVLRAYEIKRSLADAKALENIRIVRSTLLSYGRTYKSLDVSEAEAFTIEFYGHKSAPFRLIGHDLNEHFGCPIFESVTDATKTYRDDLQQVLTREPVAA